MSVPDELGRARQLAFAADECAAKDLLLSLESQIEQADQDDWMLEAYAQLGELYLVRTAYEGVREALRRIRDCLAIYDSILGGTAAPDVVAKLSMTTVEVRHLVRHYGRRAGFLETGLAAAMGDHESAASARLALADEDDEFADLSDEHTYLRIYADVLCAAALCEDDLHVRSVPLWRNVIQHIETSSGSSEAADNLRILGGIGYARFCIETGRLDEAQPWLRRAGARAEARGWEWPPRERSWSGEPRAGPPATA